MIRFMAALAVMAYALYTFNTWWGNYQEKERSLQEMTVARNNAHLEAVAATAALSEKIANEKRLELLLAESIKHNEIDVEKARRQREIFEEHDLQKLTNAKPQWLEKLANQATKERIDAMQSAFND